MWKDPIVKAVRKARQAQAAAFDYDIKAIIEDARTRQRLSKRRIVSFPANGQRDRQST